MQQFPHWQCVVVDDGSTDDTAEIVQGYRDRDERFVLVRQENTGTAGAYRAGIREATASLLCICSADDLLLPAHLRLMDEFIRANPRCDIFSSNGEYLYEGTGIRRAVYTQPEWSHERSLSLEQVIAASFYSVGVVFRRAAYELVGGHRLGVYGEDYDLWLRLMARGARHTYTPHVLSVHRISEFQKSAGLARLYESNIEVYEHLLATEALGENETKAVVAAIAGNKFSLQRVDVETAMTRQARLVRRILARLLGPRHAWRVIVMIQQSSLITDLRRAVATRAARTKRQR